MEAKERRKKIEKRREKKEKVRIAHARVRSTQLVVESKKRNDGIT